MASLTQSQQIYFTTDSQGSHVFQKPAPLFLWSMFMPCTAGLYAILVPDRCWKPMPYRVIYFGQTENFSKRGFPCEHEKYQEWLNESHGLAAGIYGSDLHIAIKQMPFSDESTRTAIETALIEKYRPSCNFKFKRSQIPGLFGQNFL